MLSLPMRVHEEYVQSTQVGSHIRVWVMHVVNPNDFFVQPSEFSMYLEYLEKYLVTTKNLIQEFEPKLGIETSYHSRKSDQWIRGTPTFVNTTKKSCTMFATDYGYIENDVEWSDMKLIPDELGLPASQLMRCSCYDSCPLGEDWDDLPIKTMKEVIEGYLVEIMIVAHVGDKFLVRFIVPNNVTDWLANCDLALISLGRNDINSIRCVFNSQLKRKYVENEYEIGDVIKVKFVHKSDDKANRFYASPIDICEEDANLLEQLTSAAESFTRLRIEDLHDGMPVCYVGESTAQRAIVECVTSTNVLLRLVDSGRTVVTTSIQDILNIGNEYLKVPRACLYCIVVDDGDFDYFGEYFHLNREFCVTIKKRKKSVIGCYLYKVSISECKE